MITTDGSLYFASIPMKSVARSFVHGRYAPNDRSPGGISLGGLSLGGLSPGVPVDKQTLHLTRPYPGLDSTGRSHRSTTETFISP